MAVCLFLLKDHLSDNKRLAELIEANIFYKIKVCILYMWEILIKISFVISHFIKILKV